jgi:hypothetical protein
VLSWRRPSPSRAAVAFSRMKVRLYGRSYLTKKVDLGLGFQLMLHTEIVEYERRGKSFPKLGGCRSHIKAATRHLGTV